MKAQSQIRLAVFLSGSGTTLQNLLDRCSTPDFPASVQLVIASKPTAYGLERAKKANIQAEVVVRKHFDNVDDFSQVLFEHCRNREIDLVCLAGFMHLIRVPEDFTNRVINVHPSLIPAFCGKGYYGSRVHQAVLDFGAKVSGCTVHFADNEYDHGPIILQKAVPVLDDDTAESLASRVQEAEREVFPEAVRLFAQGKLHIDGQRVRISS